MCAGSTIYLAKAVPDDGEVVSIENSTRFAAIAQRNFVLNGLSDKITLYEGDAFEVSKPCCATSCST